jgi:hypothetical protein
MKIPFKQIYFAGCSHTAGGGLSEAIDWYSERDVHYKNAREVSYPKLVSDHFNLPKIDKSLSGTGVIKIIKDFYSHINSDEDNEAKNTLFIFQFNESPFRVNEWSNDLNNNFNMYVLYQNDKIYDSQVLEEWMEPNPYSQIQVDELKSKKQIWLDSFYDCSIYEQNIKTQLIGFISYLTLHNFNFIFTCEYFESNTLGDILCKNKFMPFGYKSIFDYASATQLRLVDLTNINDDHPSVEAHNLYANELITHIIKKYT